MKFLKSTFLIIGLLFFFGEKNTFSNTKKTIVKTAKRVSAAAKKAIKGAKETNVGVKEANVGVKEANVGVKGVKEAKPSKSMVTKAKKETSAAKIDPNFVSKPWATTPKSPKIMLQPKGPYEVRMDPRFKLEGKPMAIDTSKFKKGEKTLHGGIRNADEFWAGWAKEFPTTLSAENLERVKKEISPVVDDVWIKAYPEHATFKGERIIHHHLDYGAYAVPLPNTVHSRAPGWSIWHYEHAAHPLDPHVE